MSDGLCWECKERWEDVGKMWGEMIPFALLHCHHEPKEKSRCWCERESVALATREFKYECRINYCPECGMKL